MLGSLYKGKFNLIMRNTCLIIFVIQVILLYLMASVLITSSDSLLQISNPLYSSMILLKKHNRLDIITNSRLALFYEKIQTKKPFRYNLGSIGRISKKSLISFWLFYFSLLFKVIGDLEK